MCIQIIAIFSMYIHDIVLTRPVHSVLESVALFFADQTPIDGHIVYLVTRYMYLQE